MTFDLAGVRNYARQNRIHDWVVSYLSTPPWANIPLRDVIAIHRPVWIGPVEIELSQLRRSAGPEAGIRWHEPQAEWDSKIDTIIRGLKQSSGLPPLIVRQEGEVLSVPDGNHRLGAMVKAGWKTGWVLIWGDRDDNLRGKWS